MSLKSFFRDRRDREEIERALSSAPTPQSRHEIETLLAMNGRSPIRLS